MIRRALAMALVAAAAAGAASFAQESARLAAGDRLRVRCDGGSVTIAGGDGDVVRAPRVRRIAPHLLEVAVSGDAAITVPRAVAVEWMASGKARLEVRDVAALHVDAAGGAVAAQRIRGNVDGRTANANVTAREIGGNVILETGNGNVTASDVRGLVDVITGNGKTAITNVRGGVHVVSINGSTEIACVAGGVTVQDTSGRTTVSSIAGDVDLFTALGQARYEGALQPNRSYRLRTLDGAVTLAARDGGSGYSARLASDAGQIDVQPPLAGKQRRVQLRAGDERARVVLDAVGGRVVLTRGTSAIPACR